MNAPVAPAAIAGIPATAPAALSSIEAITAALGSVGYIANRQVATAVYLAHHLRKPVLIEGPAGVGKTELAVSAAKALGHALIRLQCYEGLDDSRALYEWQYGKQLLYTQILKEKIGQLMADADTLAQAYTKLTGFQDLFFSRDFLQPRPLLQAMEQAGGSVLLIDEIDKSEESFEALLLEVLADYQVTVPEIGTIRAQVPPLVILTSNNTRELGDALKRRCLHLHIGFPEPAFEQQVLRARVPGIDEALLRQLVAFVQALRQEHIRKPPSVAESMDWARTLLLLHAGALDETLVRDTLNVLLKRESDIQAVQARLPQLTRDALAASRA
ncbi:AAA family ATPase [Aquabacterium sp. OR-4]|uniref:AAA family ATPase n=1 Tax=Aquabacterium sp. OR-4 TaxID=2978127 RepID=UPI0021B27B3E|nr:MoxR family ATPase [Aquabacterium sp. OR-4]MDT7838148.1 MoxR family ATPase [Aquabacterium sp. OR-4]